MADSVPVYIVPPPRGKPSPWKGIQGYWLYLRIGMAILIGLRLLALVLSWFV